MIKEIPEEGIEYIYSKGELLCVILRSNYNSDKIKFFTPSNFSQQLGYLPHRKGDVIQAHRHVVRRREVHATQEVIFIKSGRVKVNLYDSEKNYVCSEVLDTGDIILLCGGGHGFEFLMDSVLIEVKQGPYIGEEDKERFTGVERK